MREKHCWLAGLGWLKPTSEQADFVALSFYHFFSQGAWATVAIIL